ncbi:hypothetical protein DICPUDRAFT_157379 [Dictyostelium purpureum]|uniref:GPR180/TMEM145 transmembrane domain-containing protein n=1 Tax=Dictyostelium purpureum TaxID=5786 RepID=F0ZYZ7_DICPU|nr:uncharacterized protein DICPUDRAFT_157379 [Dictyostelium purpureum]EGC30831.1 hypothetical protein DICPUDRAFT_157379 [Dictyostelium purpureum]|eukprot:XP_003292645.1 hypothetical protein DICPUDRAFT_157379 [Dictyostelium purpureum]
MKLLILLLISLLINGALSINYSGKYFKPTEFRFLARFGFSSEGGTMELQRFQSNYNTTKILLYSDGNKYFDKIVNDFGKNKMRCVDKINMADYEYSLPDPVGKPNENRHIYDIKPISQQRDRVWVVAIADCSSQFSHSYKPAYKSYYTFELSNNGDKFDKELSVEQQSIPQAHIFFFLLFTIFLAISIVYTVVLSRKGLQNKVPLFFSIILVVFLVSLGLFIANWAHIIKFRKYEKKFLNLFGNIFMILGNGLFVALILMIGQGWTTSIYYGTIIKKVVNAFVVSALVIVGWALYIVFAYKSPEQNNYIYFMDTCGGYVLAVFYVVIIIYFCWTNLIIRTKQNDEVKKNFILTFTIIFAFWLISHPLVVIVAHFMDPWVKYKVIALLNLAINTIFFIILLILFRPTNENPIVAVIETDKKLGDRPMEIKEDGAGENKVNDLNILQ